MTNGDWTRLDQAARQVLRSHSGVARTSAFRKAGITGWQLGALLGRGVLERPRDAWYVDPQLPWRAKHAIRVGGVLTGESAAESYGLPVPPGWWLLLHVLLPQNAPRVRHHRDKRHYVVPGEDQEVAAQWADRPGTLPGWRTSVVETLLRLAPCVPLPWFVAALDAALHRPRGGDPLLSAGDLAALLDLLPSGLRAAAGRANPLAESCIETLIRLGLEDRGIGWIALQFQAHPLHRVDLLLRGRIIVEVDGEAFHDPVRDAIRDAELAALGYRVLRFSYRRIVGDLEVVLDEIEAAVIDASTPCDS